MKISQGILGITLLGGCVALGLYWGGSDRPAPVRFDQPAAVVAAATPRPSSAVADVHQPIMPLFRVEQWNRQEPDPQPLQPGETFASRQVEAIGQVQARSLPQLASLRQGQEIRLPGHDEAPLMGRVNLVNLNDDGWVRVGGSLADGRGSFVLSQKGPAFHGRILQPGLHRAYVIATAPDGTVSMLQKPLSSVQCEAIPRKPRPVDASAGVQAAPPVAAGPVGNPNIPSLDSYPTATDVIYLDFRGGTATDPDWNNGTTITFATPTMGGHVLTADQITDIWKRVVEDYKPYKISVTTIESRYTGATPRNRMRCLITPTDTASPGAGGVSYTDSYRQAGIDFSTTIPCWAFAEDYYSTADVSGIISHELGHTFGLSHDGQTNPDSEYYDGQGSGATSWAPIMGATYDHIITQWSKGEYPRANNHEDDIAIIGNAANGVGFVADEDPSGPVVLPNTGTLNITGVISSSADTDSWQFTTPGGLVSLSANPAPVEPDLDILLEIRNATGTTVVASANPIGHLNATLSTTLAAGTYRIVLRGTGEGNPLITGYTSYGSVGAYTLTGTYVNGPIPAPQITASPSSVAVTAGTKVTFQVSAASPAPLTYQWQKDKANISGQTASSLVIPSAQVANQGAYRCIVTNVTGSATSDEATLTVNYKPVITKQPAGASVAVGSATPVTLSVTANGTPALSYQWQKGTTDLTGKTSDTLTLSNPQWADAGTYRCIVSNAFGSTPSGYATVTVLSPPVILTHPPASKELPRGGTGSIAIVGGGSPTLTYQWYQGVNKVPGGTKAVLSFSKITDAMAGAYHCVVTNSLGSAPSNDCVVTVAAPPAITRQPAGATVATGSGFTLSVTATGSPALSYQWQKDGVNIATGDTFTVAASTWNDRGAYRCIVTNGCGAATSSTATVTIQSGPIILTPPADTKVAIGGRTTLKVAATGSPTLRYQWRKNSVNLPGATAASLTVTGTTDADYDVVISNAFNTAGVTSSSAHVTALAAPKITQQPLTATRAIGGSVDFTLGATGAPTLLYQWRKNNVILNGETSATLHLDHMLASDAAAYTVTVSNEVGAAASAAAKLTLLAPPKISVQPLPKTANAWDAVTFTSAATGAATIKYHWQKDGADLIGNTSTTLKLSNVQPSDEGEYRMVAVNSVGTDYSDPVRLTVNPVQSPSVSEFYPPQGPVGSLVRVVGANLNWTTAVAMQKSAGTPVAAAFVIVSPTELLVTVPAGAATSALSITTHGGTAATSGPFVVTPGQANDDFVNAAVIPGTGGKASGSNAKMTGEPGEPYHAMPADYDPAYASDYAPSYSVWYRWTPTVTGNYYVSTAGSKFDTRVAVYTGSSLATLTEVASDDDVSATVWTSYATFNATAGTTYFIAVDGFYIDWGDGTYSYERGAYALAVGKLVSGTGIAATGEPAPEALEPPALPQSTTVGKQSAQAWLSADGASADFSVQQGSLAFAYAAPAGTADALRWKAYGGGNQFLFGLGLDTGTGILSVLDIDGRGTATGQTLVAGEHYRLEWRITPASHTWGVLLNGEWIVRDQPLPSGAVLEKMLAEWSPAAASTAPASLSIEDFAVTYE